MTSMALALTWLPLGLLTVGVGVLLIEMVAAWPVGSGARRRTDPRGPRPRVAVLVPAHNESAGIVPTLQSVRAQLQPGDRLVVVADNCSDDTAAVASLHGAEVVVRTDPHRRGKGFALDHGVRALDAAPPDVLIVLDADCISAEGAIDRLAAAAAATGRPVQALYLMLPPQAPSLRQRVATFAWRVKNHLRPLGLQRLGLPCQLMGTGMAFPWALARSAPLASGHLVEDMQLGVDLALSGAAPSFEPQALVTSEFPVHEAATQSQRTRWEHGHLQVLFSRGPRLLSRGVVRGDMGAVALALDLMIPPLSLLFIAVVVMSMVASIVGLSLGSPLLAGWGLGLLLAMGLAIALAWHRVGRGVLSVGDLVRAPAYALAKLPMYVRFLAGRQVEWVRTRRRSE